MIVSKTDGTRKEIEAHYKNILPFIVNRLVGKGLLEITGIGGTDWSKKE